MFEAHVFMSSFFLFWRSVCCICFPATATGVDEAFVAFAVGFRTNQPYAFVFTLPTLPVGSEKRSLSNSATVWPLLNDALPQFELDDGSFEYFFASLHQSPPLESCEKRESASEAFALPTRM